MIITCEQCQAQFQLPDERIPAKGARVRCSKCKHAFFVAHPGDSGRAPAPSEDVVRSAESTASAKPAAPKPQSAVPPGSRSAPTSNFDREDEVGDWGFNEDEKAKSGSFGKAKALPDAALFEEPNPDLNNASALTEDDSPMGAPDGLGFAGEDEGEMQSSAPTEGVGGDFADLFPEEQPAAASPVPEQAEKAPTASDGLGNFDDWDFFGDGKTKSVAEAAPPSGTEDFFDSLGTADQKPSLPNVAPVVVAPLKKAPSPLPPWFDLASSIAGWSVVAIMVLVIAFESMTPAETFVAPKEGSLKIGALAADGVRGRMIENAVSGMVYVVSGQLRNDSKAPAAAGTALRVVLIDERGNAIANTGAAMAGFALADYQLREEKADELQKRLETDAAQLAWTNLASAETVQFNALFLSMPSDAVGFRIETVDVAKPKIGTGLPEDSAAALTHESVDEDAGDALATSADAALSGEIDANAQAPSPESVEAPTEQDASVPATDSISSPPTPGQEPSAAPPTP